MKIAKIVSGGQTGADRGGLDAAIHCQLPHVGWCPKGRKAEDGVIPPIYNLKEMNSADYLARTEANVVDSEATLIFTFGKLEGGSARTQGFARRHGRPCLHIDLDACTRQQATDTAVAWLNGLDQDGTKPGGGALNIAGSRASKAPDLQQYVMAVMVDVISAVNGKLFYPINLEG